MGKLEQQSNLRQLPGDRRDSREPSGTFCCGRCPVALRWIYKHLSLRCLLFLVLGLAVFLSSVFWIIPLRSRSLGFDAKASVKLSATVQASFKLEKPVSELLTRIARLEYDIYGEIGAPATKVAILSMHRAGSSNYTDVAFGVLSDPLSVPIDEVSLIVLRTSFVELFLRLVNLTLTESIFGQTSDFQILKFPGGVTVIPEQTSPIWPIPQVLFNFSLGNSISDIEGNSDEFREQLKEGLHLKPYESVYIGVTNAEGSTLAPSIIVQASIMSDLGGLLPERLKELAETIKGSSRNLGLDNSEFGKVKSVMLSSYLNSAIEATSPSPSPAPSPGPSYQNVPSVSPNPAPSSYPPAQSPDCSPTPPCVSCEVPSPSPGMEPISPVPSVPPAQPPQAQRRFGPRVAPQPSPELGTSPVFPPRAHAPALPPGNGGHTQDLVSPSLAPSSSSFAVQLSCKEIWLLGFSGFLIHLLCCIYW